LLALAVITEENIKDFRLGALFSDAQETSQSFWDIPRTSLMDKKCGGYLEHIFVRNDGIMEKVTFPVIAVPIEIE
jgi:hypothetical protein